MFKLALCLSVTMWVQTPGGGLQSPDIQSDINRAIGGHDKSAHTNTNGHDKSAPTNTNGHDKSAPTDANFDYLNSIRFYLYTKSTPESAEAYRRIFYNPQTSSRNSFRLDSDPAFRQLPDRSGQRWAVPVAITLGTGILLYLLYSTRGR